MILSLQQLQSLVDRVPYSQSRLHLLVIVKITHSQFFAFGSFEPRLIPNSPVKLGYSGLNFAAKGFRAQPNNIVQVSSHISQTSVQIS